MGCEDWNIHELFVASETSSNAQPKQESSGRWKQHTPSPTSILGLRWLPTLMVDTVSVRLSIKQEMAKYG